MAWTSKPATFSGRSHLAQPKGASGADFQVKAGMSIPTPRQIGDRLYLTCFYDGSLMLKIPVNNKPVVLWKRTKRVEDPTPDITEQLHCVMSTPAIRDGFIYGVCSYGDSAASNWKPANGCGKHMFP